MALSHLQEPKDIKKRQCKHKDPEWAQRARKDSKSLSAIIGRPKEHSDTKPKLKPKPEWKTTSLRKKDETAPTMTQPDYWKEARPDWAKGKSPVGDKPKLPDKPKPKEKDYWEEAKPEWAKAKSPVGDKPKLPDKPKPRAKDYLEEARPDWTKGKGSVAKPSAGDLKKVEEKKKYGYPTPEWATRVRGKDKASDEKGGNKGLLKAELEGIFGKPKPNVRRRHSSEDLSESYRANIRKFADHRISLRVKTKHRPSSTPVRQLLSRDDVRSEL